MGNTTAYAGVTLTYNNRGRLSTTGYAGNSASHTYDVDGLRIQRVSTLGGTTVFVHDEAGRLIGEYDGSGALIQETVWLQDIPVATLRPRVGGGIDVFYVHADHLNSPRVVTRSSDNAQRWRWQSEPFGSTAPNEDPSGAGTFAYNLRFPGQVYDGAAGHYQNWHREYDAATGRYVESDPIGIDGGTNTYGFVLQSPTMLVDTDGLQARPPPPRSLPGGPPQRFPRGSYGLTRPPVTYSHSSRYNPSNARRQYEALSARSTVESTNSSIFDPYRRRYELYRNFLDDLESARKDISDRQALADLLERIREARRNPPTPDRGDYSCRSYGQSVVY
jgi:RHS repeat-associated protein